MDNGVKTPSTKSMVQRTRVKDFVFIVRLAANYYSLLTLSLGQRALARWAESFGFGLPIFDSPHSSRPSPNYLVRSCQHVRRDGQADLPGIVEIDNELKFGRLLDREVGGLGAFEDLVDVNCSALK